MRCPRLIEARPRELLGAPRAALRQAAYSVAYELAPPPGGCLLQRVETVVRFRRGERALATYRAVYWEYFQAGADPAELRRDEHDFQVDRDGWGPGPISRLLRRHGVEPGGGLARLECEKRFLLGPGLVEETAPALGTAGGGAFGWLAEVEGERPERTLLLDGEARDVSHVARPLPGPVAGRGRFTGPARLEARERLWFELATLGGEVEVVPYRAPV